MAVVLTECYMATGPVPEVSFFILFCAYFWNLFFPFFTDILVFLGVGARHLNSVVIRIHSVSPNSVI